MTADDKIAGLAQVALDKLAKPYNPTYGTTGNIRGRHLRDAEERLGQTIKGVSTDILTVMTNNIRILRDDLRAGADPILRVENDALKIRVGELEETARINSIKLDKFKGDLHLAKNLADIAAGEVEDERVMRKASSLELAELRRSRERALAAARLEGKDAAAEMIKIAQRGEQIAIERCHHAEDQLRAHVAHEGNGLSVEEDDEGKLSIIAEPEEKKGWLSSLLGDG